MSNPNIKVRGFWPNPSKRYIPELARSVLMGPNQPARRRCPYSDRAPGGGSASGPGPQQSDTDARSSGPAGASESGGGSTRPGVAGGLAASELLLQLYRLHLSEL